MRLVCAMLVLLPASAATAAQVDPAPPTVAPLLDQHGTPAAPAPAAPPAWTPSAANPASVDAERCTMMKASRDARLAALAKERAEGTTSDSAIDDPQVLKRYWDQRVRRACG